VIGRRNIGEDGEANEDEAIFGTENLIWASGPARLTRQHTNSL